MKEIKLGLNQKSSFENITGGEGMRQHT